MNKKGLENLNVGTFVLMAVAVIVALTLLTGGISNNVGAVTSTTTYSNYTFTSGAVGSSVNLPVQAVKGTIILTNASSGTLIPATNYTITNYVVSNGALVTQVTSNGGIIGFQGKSVNISSTVVEPFGYDTSAGGRTVTSLIIVFAALALVVTIMVPIIKNGVLDFN